MLVLFGRLTSRSEVPQGHVKWTKGVHRKPRQLTSICRTGAQLCALHSKRRPTTVGAVRGKAQLMIPRHTRAKRNLLKGSSIARWSTTITCCSQRQGPKYVCGDLRPDSIVRIFEADSGCASSAMHIRRWKLRYMMQRSAPAKNCKRLVTRRHLYFIGAAAGHCGAASCPATPSQFG